MPIISIIVPVYNVEKYLDRCVESILNQTFTDFQLILVDDGSKDKSPAICNRWSQKDKRIKVIHKENAGASAARNEGLKHATGEYVGFVDADDWIARDMYQYLFHLITRHHADVAACGFTRRTTDMEYGTQGERLTFLDSKEMWDYFYRVNGEPSNYSIWNRLYRRDILKGITFLEGKITEDVMFSYEVTQKANCMVVSNLKKYLYFKNELGVTRSRLCKKDMDLLEIWDLIVQKEGENRYWAKLNRKRATFTLYTKAMMYGCEATIDKKILRQWKQEIRSCYAELMKSPFFDKKRKLMLWLIKTF